MNKSLSYSDIFLIPEYSPFHTRDEANTKVKFGPREFRLPVVPANMKCVIDENTARWCSANDYFYIMHRFNKVDTDEPNKDNWEFLVKANAEKWKTISISLGVQEYDKQFMRNTLSARLRIDYITLDIAHAHSIRMKEMLEFIKNINVIDYAPFIIAGNVATPDAVIDLENWGAESVKCGIAGGSACSTYGMTGFGVPMFSNILECSAVAKKPIIADGGIKTNGDIAKAVRAGATMVMAGSVFAACTDAPGENIYAGCVDEKTYFWIEDKGFWIEDKGIIAKKVYFGSASEYNKHTKRHVEGTKIELPCNGKTYAEKYAEILDSYSSAISYAGGNMDTVKWGTK